MGGANPRNWLAFTPSRPLGQLAATGLGTRSRTWRKAGVASQSGVLMGSTSSGATARRLNDDAVARIVAKHGQEMLAIARAHSAIATDAEDAYQSALEALITKAPTDDEDQLGAWLNVVTRNEALMILRRRKHVALSSFDEIAATFESAAVPMEERIVEDESRGQRREALQRLKPDQLRCLLLKAEGYRYAEISAITGFTYASVNRYLTEGRRACRTALGNIASGGECKRLEPVLSLIADDEATSMQLADANMHLAHCAACRAVLIEFRTAPSRIAALFPVAFASAGTAGGVLGQIADAAKSVYAGIHDRALGLAAGLQPTSEMSVAKKAAAIGAIGAALTAGGAGVGQVVIASQDQTVKTEQTAEPPAGPSAIAGPENGTPGNADGERERERNDKPVTPTEAEVHTARDRAKTPPATPPSDAGAGEDTFNREPQLEAPPDTVDGGSGGGGGETLDGLAP